MSLKHRTKQVLGRFAFVRLAFRLVWEAAGRWTFAWGGLLLIQGILPAVLVYLTKRLVDGVAVVIGTGIGWEQAAPVLVPGGIMGAIIIIQRLLTGATEYVSTAQAEFVQDHIKKIIHDQAAAVDYAFYESAEYYDLLDRANSQAGSRALALLQNVGAFLQSGITFFSMAVLLLGYSVWIPLLLVVSTIPAFLILVRYNRIHHDWWKRTTSDRRWAQYYDLMLTLQAAAAEVRLNSLGTFFTSGYQALRKRLRVERLALIRRQALAKLGASAVAILVTAGTMGWIFIRAMQGLATLGDLALFYQAFSKGQSLMSTLLRNVGQVYNNTLYLEHLGEFIDQPSLIVDPPEPVSFPSTIREGVHFEHVTFSYPGNEKPALQDFSLFIPAGKIVAIVGENGAGKSTLIKLLCRFYDPNIGKVTVDGIDLRHLAQADLRRHISVMFQFPMKYQLTARQSIMLGDLDAPLDEARVEAAARGGGAHDIIERLPKQYDTLLGRWFEEGSELSGGEWQRIALARAFYRQAPLIVLDEPTSFMDSWSENEWLQRFRRLVKDQSVLVVTHRLTMAKQADIIHVMDRGQVVESGTHEDLLQAEGRYAQSWLAQLGSEELAKVA